MKRAHKVVQRLLGNVGLVVIGLEAEIGFHTDNHRTGQKFLAGFQRSNMFDENRSLFVRICFFFESDQFQILPFGALRAPPYLLCFFLRFRQSTGDSV